MVLVLALQRRRGATPKAVCHPQDSGSRVHASENLLGASRKSNSQNSFIDADASRVGERAYGWRTASGRNCFNDADASRVGEPPRGVTRPARRPCFNDADASRVGEPGIGRLRDHAQIASMMPTLHASENVTLAALPSAASEASMMPTLHASENTAHSFRRCKGRACFNDADASRVGEPEAFSGAMSTPAGFNDADASRVGEHAETDGQRLAQVASMMPTLHASENAHSQISSSRQPAWLQ